MIVAATCHQHPQRPAFARCMVCGVAVCQECATPFAGIQHCRACLAKKTAPQKSRAFLGPLLHVALIAGCGWMVCHLLVWSAGVVVGWWR